jgi:DNA-binding MarR family transcriptional regulator
VVHPPFDEGTAERWGADPDSAKALRAFKRAIMLHRRLLMAVLASEGPIHPAQAGCVQVLSERDGASQSDLAEALHVSRPTVTVMLQRMEAAGLVERRPDAADSRVTRVYLTEQGRALAERMRAAFGEIVALSIGRLPEDERSELARPLEKLNAEVAGALEERGLGASAHPHDHDHGEAR